MAQKVKFKRHTTAEIEELEVEDGALIYNIENGKTYMDYGTNRIQTGGNADTMISIGDEEPTDEDIKIWINTPTSETKASEIVNEYTDSDKVGYSTRYMNNALESIVDIYSTDEIKTNKIWIDGKPIYRKVLDITNIGATGTQYNHGISNLETLVDVYGSWDKTGSGRQPLTRVVTGAMNEYGVGVGDVATTNFRLHYGTNVTGVTHIYVIFEYTKTTDQGGV